MATAVYMRISTTDQTTASQKADVTAWLERNPQTNLVWYTDHGQSRMTLARPRLRELRNAIAAGQIDCVIVQRLDRLCGTLREGLNLLHEWTEGGIRVVAVRQQIDLSGAIGRLVAAVLLGVSEMEMEIRKERQRAGIDAALADVRAGRRKHWGGGKPGRYRKSSVQRVHELRAKGLKAEEIAKALGISRCTVYQYLKHPLEMTDREPLDAKPCDLLDSVRSDLAGLVCGVAERRQREAEG